MAFYSRHQLLVLIALVTTFGGGLAVERWRGAHPETVERLERFDRARAEVPDGSNGQDEPPRPPKLRADGTGQIVSQIDLNRATVEELIRLPGVGPALAARIVEARNAEPFGSVEDLRRIRGLGESKLERMRPLVTVSPP